MLFDKLADMVIGSAGGGEAVFGRKPGVAGYTATDPGTEAKRAVKSNIDNSADIAALLEKILPGYGEMVKKGSDNTLALLKGEIPKDVQDAIYRSGAFKSLAGGFGGSGMSKSLTARDLGLTSLDLMAKGENSAQRWAGLTESSVAPFEVTGKDQTDATFRNNLYKQAVEQFKFNVEAAPDPSAAGLFNLTSAIGSTAASFGMGSALGGIGGGRAATGPTAGGYNFAYAYPAPTYATGYPTANASGNAPYAWGG
jgi:hypothetical protein